jgi:hypothetical protein
MQHFAKNGLAKHRLTIVECEGPGALIAHYNPKELQIERQVAWKDEGLGLEYSGEVHGRKLTLELFFDCFEYEGDLEPELETLHRLTLPLDPESGDSIARCPPVVKLDNAPFKSLRYVIEAVSIKMTMFVDSRPVRATATVTLKEVTRDQSDDLRRRFKKRPGR